MRGVSKKWAILEGKDCEFPEVFEGFSEEGYEYDAPAPRDDLYDSELAIVVSVWSKLPPSIRAGIVAMVGAVVCRSRR